MSQEIRLADVERLAAALEAAELGEEERAMLHAVFALAGSAAAQGASDGEDEVAGFSLSVVPDSLLGSFQLGGTTGGGSGGIQITKQIGAASPQLLNAHWTSETLTSVTFKP
jgi:hypothetical protein